MSICFINRCLHLAIICGEEAYAVQTIKMATLRESLSIYNNLQQTPLHLAVLTNQPCLVQLLVAWGAVVDARDRHGNTPLHIACRYVGHVTIVCCIYKQHLVFVAGFGLRDLISECRQCDCVKVHTHSIVEIGPETYSWQ